MKTFEHEKAYSNKSNKIPETKINYITVLKQKIHRKSQGN